MDQAGQVLGVTSTRRELLSTLVGSAVAAGCRKTPDVVGWDGGFVDDHRTLGHRIREGFRPQATTTETHRVVIIGGGIAGLVAGWWLRRHSEDRFVVLELADRVGGTAVSGKSDVTAFPWGAHYLPAPGEDNADLVTLAEDFGSVVSRSPGTLTYEEAHLCADPKERLFFEGTWHPGLYPRAGASSADLEQLQRFEAEVDRCIGWRDKHDRRAFTLPIAAGSDDPEMMRLDEITLAKWMEQQGFTSPRLRWYVDYACRDDFGTRPEHTSAWYGLHYFAARTPKPEATSAEFLTWPAGNGYIVDHLARRIESARLRTRHAVTSVQPRDDGRRLEVTAWDARAQLARGFVADRVIFALPSFLRSRILPDLKGTGPSVRYAPWMVANLHLAGRPGYRGFEMAWDNVLYDSPSLGYVVATHQGGRSFGPTVWTYYLPLSGQDARQERKNLESLTYREAADAVVQDLDRAHIDLKRHLRRVDIRRWGHAMVTPVPGVAGARGTGTQPANRVHFAHTDLSGVALFEEAFFHGVRAAKEVLSHSQEAK